MSGIYSIMCYVFIILNILPEENSRGGENTYSVLKTPLKSKVKAGFSNSLIQYFISWLITCEYVFAPIKYC